MPGRSVERLQSCVVDMRVGLVIWSYRYRMSPRAQMNDNHGPTESIFVLYTLDEILQPMHKAHNVKVFHGVTFLLGALNSLWTHGLV